MNQIFWNAYKRLEKEVFALSEVLHFDDRQKNVYSAKIGDLLVRTAIEIESLSKVLCEREGGITPEERHSFFDTKCLAYLDKKWKIESKMIFLSSPFFYFEDETMKTLRPLQNASKFGRESSKWNQAYQAVKHDRVKNLHQGNIENLLNALGSLFILNIYYRDAIVENVADGKASNIDWGLGSELFTVRISQQTDGLRLDKVYAPKADYDESIYLVKHTDESARPVIDLLRQINSEAMRSATNSIADAMNQKISSGELETVQDLDEIKRVIKDLYDELSLSALSELTRKNSQRLVSAINGLRFEAVLNKRQF